MAPAAWAGSAAAGGRAGGSTSASDLGVFSLRAWAAERPANVWVASCSVAAGEEGGVM